MTNSNSNSMDSTDSTIISSEASMRLVNSLPATVVRGKDKKVIPVIKTLVSVESVLEDETTLEMIVNSEDHTILLDSSGNQVTDDEYITEPQACRKVLTAHGKVQTDKISVDSSEKLLNAIFPDQDKFTPSELPLNPVIKKQLSKMLARMDNSFQTMLQEVIDTATMGSLGIFLNRMLFRKHVLITGDAGHGKTYGVDEFLRAKKIPNTWIFINSGTRAYHLLGNMVKLLDGNFAWKDGALTEVFRKAQTEPCVLAIDEMLRAQPKELNILISALTPNSVGNYVLRIDRPTGEAVDGVVKDEIIEVPQENLWVVATTNQGMGYEATRIDNAMRDRFRMYYHEMADDQMMEIIKAQSDAKLKTTAKVKPMMQVVSKSVELCKTGALKRPFTIRHISEVITACDGDVTNLVRAFHDLKTALIDIDSDGRFNEQQMSIVSDLITKHIGAK